MVKGNGMKKCVIFCALIGSIACAMELPEKEKQEELAAPEEILHRLVLEPPRPSYLAPAPPSAIKEELIHFATIASNWSTQEINSGIEALSRQIKAEKPEKEVLEQKKNILEILKQKREQPSKFLPIPIPPREIELKKTKKAQQIASDKKQFEIITYQGITTGRWYPDWYKLRLRALAVNMLESLIARIQQIGWSHENIDIDWFHKKCTEGGNLYRYKIDVPPSESFFAALRYALHSFEDLENQHDLQVEEITYHQSRDITIRAIVDLAMKGVGRGIDAPRIIIATRTRMWDYIVPQDKNNYLKSEIAQLNSNYKTVIDALNFHNDQEALKSLPTTLNLDDLANYQLGECPKVKWIP